MWPFRKKSDTTKSKPGASRGGESPLGVTASSRANVAMKQTRRGDGTILGDLIAKGLYNSDAGSEALGHFNPDTAPFRALPHGKTGLIQRPMTDQGIDLSMTLALKLRLQSTRAVLDAFQTLVQRDKIAKYLIVTTTMPFFLTYSTDKVVVIAEVEHELKLNTLANLLLNDAAFSSVRSLEGFENRADSLLEERKAEVEEKKRWAVEKQAMRT